MHTVYGTNNAVASQQLLYIHADHLNTPRAMSDASKKIVWKWESEAYGRGAPNGDPDGDGVQARLDLRFPGQIADLDTGLYYNMNRYYDPIVGRYTQSDPIGLEGGLNTYGYVNGNPLSYIDPFGLDREIIFWSPLPHPGSVFGHVSSRGGNEENFSFGPEGWDSTYPTANQYIDRQTTNNKRAGMGVVVELSKEQDAKYDQCMSAARTAMSADSYNVVTNCGSPSQVCLGKVGVSIFPSILPGSYQQELLNSGSVKSINWYGRRR